MGASHMTCENLVYIGAGWNPELDGLPTPTKALILVEPLYERAQQLRMRHSSSQLTEVLEVAVGDPARKSLKIYNKEGLESLRQPLVLCREYPGLRLLYERPVDVITIEALLDKVQVDFGELNALVIDCPGEEEFIVESLKRQSLLEGFLHLRLYCGEANWYKQSAGAGDLSLRLTRAGFDVTARSRRTGDGGSCLDARRIYGFGSVRDELSRQARSLKRLEGDFQDVSVALEKTAREIERVNADKEKIQRRLDRMRRRYEESTEALEKRTAEVSHLKERSESLKSEKEALHACVDAAAKDRERATRLALARRRRVQELQQYLQGQENRYAQIEDELRKTEAQIRWLDQQVCDPGSADHT